MTHNNISYLEVLEKKRSNRVQEKETNRANLAKEENTRYGVDVDAETRYIVAGLSKESAQTVAQISAGASIANARLNSETQRYIADQNVELQYDELYEKGRHNQQTESLGWNQLEQDEHYRGEDVRIRDNSVLTGTMGDFTNAIAKLLPGLLGLGGKK